ncbi:PREDICTED: uncharacterized protein LOC100634190 [Amphimedon queenslandica]|uniref:Uncharacterized protein n=2 Tax=Amphimedon queenslandica TaxID=400682 RepID=A0AAN0J4P7_AMPQE|nr:PREDICTED: uncharacterized protein LOC100634190 [Amphimedon queenslandica]|eukprot:XP_019851989.1 PREDICTED: uncharacterized protein LOC100634190 [Amphimedon queenslandica]
MASILLKDKTGSFSPSGSVQEGEDPWEFKVFKGEFVVQLCQKEICRIKGVTLNYRLYHDAQIVLHADPVDVVPLDEGEIEYLQAVRPSSVRLKEYLNEENKKMKLNLVVGDKVIFKLKLAESVTSKITPTPSVNGTIHYIGHHPDSDGIIFGIEIAAQDHTYRGKGTSNGKPYFTCRPKNAVFVAMDKIIKKQDPPARTRSSQGSYEPSVIEQPRPTTRSQTKPGAASGQPAKSVYDRVKGFIKDFSVFSIEVSNTAEEGGISSPAHKSRFKKGDRVILQTVKEEVVAGTVRWVGPIRVAKDMKIDPLPVVGIETDTKIDPLKDFDDAGVNITGTHGTKLFKVAPTHSRVFLPEQLVLTVDEYTMQQQRDHAARFKQGHEVFKQDDATEKEKKLAAEHGMTVVEYQQLQEGFVAAKQGKDDGKVHVTGDPKIEEEMFAVGGGTRIIQGGREGLNELTITIKPMRFAGPEIVSKERIEEEEKALETTSKQQQRRINEQQHGQKDFQDNNERRGGDNDQQQRPNLSVMGESIRLQQPHQPQQSSRAQHLHNEGGERETASLPSNDNTRNHSPCNDPGHQDHGHYDNHQYQDWDPCDPACYDDHHGSGHYSPDPPSGPLPDPGDQPAVPPPNPLHFQFNIGSMVYIDTQKGDPLYGMVKWIGTLPDYPGTIAGVELERPLQGCTDGTWGGRRFFTCPYGKGYFCPLNILKQDTRYVDMTQSDAPLDFQSILTADGNEIHKSSMMEEDYPKDEHLLPIYAKDNSITEATDESPIPNSEYEKEATQDTKADMNNQIVLNLDESYDEFETDFTKESLYKLQQERPQCLQDTISKKPLSSFEGIISIQQQMHADLAWYNTNFDHMIRHCEELFDNLEERRSNFRQRESQLQKVYKQNIIKMKELNEDLTSCLRSLQDSHNSLTKEHQQLQMSHDTLTTNHQKLLKSHDTMTADHQELQNSHDNLSRNYQELQKSHNSLKMEHHKLHNSLKKEYHELQKLHNSLTLERQELQKSHDSLKMKHQELQKSHDSLKMKHQELQKSHNSLKMEHQELHKSNATLTTSHEELQTSHNNLKIAHQQEVTRHQKSQEEIENRLKQINQRLVQTQEELAAKQNEVAKLQSTLQKLENNWKVSCTDVTLSKKELGRGGWGVIWIGEFRGQSVAVKQMHELIKSDEYMELLHREINTMSQLRHPNLLQFIGAVLDHPSGNPMIITEVMDTSLRSAYERKEFTTNRHCRPVILSIMRDVAVGLNYLHCLPDPIIHRDVSSANVLLESKGDKKWKTKISDFGSAKFAHAAVTAAPGAAVYSAPESIATIHRKKRRQTTKMDSHSYGVLLCEVLTCRFPDEEIFEALLKQVKASSPQLHELIVSCIDEEPDKRPTMSEIIIKLDHFIANK